MRIVVLGTRGFPDVQGGVERHCQNLYPRLVKSGCEVIVFARSRYLKKRVSRYQGVVLISLDCLKGKFLESLSHTFIGILAAKKLGPDLLHVHAIGPSMLAPLARALGLRVLVTNHGPDYDRKKWNMAAKFVLRFSEYLGCLAANSIICVSKTIARGIREKYGADSRVIPNGVSEIKITQTRQHLERCGVREGKYILSVGRLVPEKGFHDLISVFLELKKKSLLDGWKLVIVGEADHQTSYSRRLKEEASVNPEITLTGFLSGSPLEELYSHAGLFVLPSYHEGLPIVLLEAMGYGLSCLVSDIPANKEVALVEERYFRAGDRSELAQKMRFFMDHRLSDEEKTGQIEAVKLSYNWDVISEQVLSVYKSVSSRI